MQPMCVCVCECVFICVLVCVLSQIVTMNIYPPPQSSFRHNLQLQSSLIHRRYFFKNLFGVNQASTDSDNEIYDDYYVLIMLLNVKYLHANAEASILGLPFNEMPPTTLQYNLYASTFIGNRAEWRKYIFS